MDVCGPHTGGSRERARPVGLHTYGSIALKGILLGVRAAGALSQGFPTLPARASYPADPNIRQRAQSSGFTREQ